MKKLNIYVVGHKKFSYPTEGFFTPIQVGKRNTGLKLPIISDDTGDNIAEKNSNFCELTALYWVWKNGLNADYIGLCHYRRYFYKTSILGHAFLHPSEKYFESVLENHDVILAKRYEWDYSVRECYSKYGEGKDKDLMKTREIIQKKYPDYLDSFDTVIGRKYASYCNMFVMSKENTDLYCKWLFSILFELENYTDLGDYTPAEARIYGYISEILLNVWVLKNKLWVKELPIAMREYR